MMDKSRWGIVSMAILILGVSIFAYQRQEQTGKDVYFAVVIGGPALVSFFGILWIGPSLGQEWRLDEGVLRTAITVATVTVFFSLLTMTTPLHGGKTEIKELPALTQTMLSNFTWVVTAVVGFYFVSSAYVQGKAIEHGRSKSVGDAK